jgi:hypothetical protein
MTLPSAAGQVQAKKAIDQCCICFNAGQFLAREEAGIVGRRSRRFGVSKSIAAPCIREPAQI